MGKFEAGILDSFGTSKDLLILLVCAIFDMVGLILGHILSGVHND